MRAKRRGTVSMRSVARTTEQPFVTWTLIAVNVGVYLITVAQGSGINSPGGKLFAKWVLFGPAVANGDWWRLITAAFLHANLLHIGLNMLALVWLGAPVERYLGHLQYLALYFVAGLAGSAGALITTPTGITVGASGAIFGILGAGLVLEREQVRGEHPDQRHRASGVHPEQPGGRRPNPRADRTAHVPLRPPVVSWPGGPATTLSQSRSAFTAARSGGRWAGSLSIDARNSEVCAEFCGR